MSEITKLEPKLIWKYFHQITQIPRPSKKEQRIVKYLIDFAKQQNLAYKTDAIGNVLITKSATKGMEHKPTVILQSHVDMVCEKNTNTIFNFDTDAIETYIDGDWVKAKGTTLGADDGIGVAAQLALLASNEVTHGKIECLFTVDEETGLSGAFALEKGFLTGNLLLNLDSEDWGELFIGCAGGVDTIATLNYSKDEIPVNSFAAHITIKGLKGGHSGGDIHIGLGNANKILNRFLYEETNKYNLRVHSLNGGNLRNAIAREANAIIVIPTKYKETLRANLNFFTSDIENELGSIEPNLRIELSSCEAPEWVIDKKSQDVLLNSVYACPHGVIAWSKTIPNLVETSTNLASVKMSTENQITITTSQRSSSDFAKDDIRQMVASVFQLAGAKVVHSDGYPGWAPNPSSAVLATTKTVFNNLFGEEPKVLAIHAGLECGLFLKKYPQLDMISFGPTIYGAHSPDERLNIKSVEKFWDLLLKVLEEIQ